MGSPTCDSDAAENDCKAEARSLSYRFKDHNHFIGLNLGLGIKRGERRSLPGDQYRYIFVGTRSVPGRVFEK